MGRDYNDNIVINGGFDASSSGWKLSGGAQYLDGEIQIPSTGFVFKTISQMLPIIPNREYLVEYTLTTLSGAVTSSVLLGDVGFSHGSSSGQLSVTLKPTSDGFIKISVETSGSGSATLDDISVRELIEESSSSSFVTFSSESSKNSSSSSLNSLSSSSSSISSYPSSNSTSDLSTESSKSSFNSSSTSSESTSSVNSSSSLSMVSSSSLLKSSESSEHKGSFDFPFRIEVDKETPIWCFERVGEHIYAGTGPNGIILRTSNLNNWDSWNTVQDCHIKCMKLYANGLWIGTEPNGYVYVYNFTTDAFYPYIKTPDHSVSAMAVFNGELFVGTSPGSNIYSFNGDVWEKRKELYGGGITSMFVINEALYVSIKSAETLIVYDGNSWNTLNVLTNNPPDDLILVGDASIEDGKGIHTIASKRFLSTEPVSRSNFKFIDREKIANIDVAINNGVLPASESVEVEPTNSEKDIKSINVFNGNLIMGGTSGRIYQYDSGFLKTIYDNSEREISIIGSDGFFCSENKLFKLFENTEDSMFGRTI